MAMPANEQRIHISGGRLIDPASEIDEQLDIFVAGGHIAAIGACLLYTSDAADDRPRV